MTKAIICDIQGVLLDDGVNRGLVDFLVNEKGNYGKLILHTNLSKGNESRLKELMPGLFNVVEKVYFYDEVKYPKPDARGLQEILKEWDLNANEVVFIDDSETNVESAAKLGMKTIHYTGLEDISNLKNLLSL